MPVPAPTSSSGRDLLVGGQANIRDLGGLATPEGQQVRRGCLIRSDNLGSLDYDGIHRLLRQVGVRMVIDLRTPLECRREGVGPLGGHGVGYRNIPLEPQSALNDEEAAAGRATNLLDDYLAHLTVSGSGLLEGFELLAEPGNLPVVVHCTAGKDRTGIFVGLLLDLLGVAREEIVADYAATAVNMPIVLERIRSSEFFQSNGLADAPTWIFESEPETMRSFLRIVAERYGGAADWARQQGASSALINALRSRLLEERPAA